MIEEKPKGYEYVLPEEQIDEYRSWPIERRLHWLLLGNRLRKMLPAKTVEIQEAFRQGRM